MSTTEQLMAATQTQLEEKTAALEESEHQQRELEKQFETIYVATKTEVRACRQRAGTLSRVQLGGQINALETQLKGARSPSPPA